MYNRMDTNMLHQQEQQRLIQQYKTQNTQMNLNDDDDHYPGGS